MKYLKDSIADIFLTTAQKYHANPGPISDCITPSQTNPAWKLYFHEMYEAHDINCNKYEHGEYGYLGNDGVVLYSSLSC